MQSGTIQVALAANRCSSLSISAEFLPHWAILQTVERTPRKFRRRTSFPPATAVEAEARCSLDFPQSQINPRIFAGGGLS
jgi:hypothetical protein